MLEYLVNTFSTMQKRTAMQLLRTANQRLINTSTQPPIPSTSTMTIWLKIWARHKYQPQRRPQQRQNPSHRIAFWRHTEMASDRSTSTRRSSIRRPGNISRIATPKRRTTAHLCKSTFHRSNRYRRRNCEMPSRISIDGPPEKIMLRKNCQRLIQATATLITFRSDTRASYSNSAPDKVAR